MVIATSAVTKQLVRNRKIQDAESILQSKCECGIETANRRSDGSALASAELIGRVANRFIAVTGAECQVELAINVVWHELYAAVAESKVRTAWMKASKWQVVDGNAFRRARGNCRPITTGIAATKNVLMVDVASGVGAMIDRPKVSNVL